MKQWTDTIHCKSRQHCKACLTDYAFHSNQKQRYIMPDYGSCPNGVNQDQLPEPVKVTISAKPNKAKGCKSCSRSKRSSFIQD